MNDKKRSLLFKFGLIFTIFTVIAVALGGLATYYSQMESYRRQCERNIRDIGAYLERLILQDQDNFAIYQRYYMAHFAEVDIPFDINNYRAAQAEYEKLFAMHHPGRTFGVDIEFDDMDPEVQKAWFIYYHEYWLLTFEEARVAFNIPYTYYLVPKEEIYHMVYMIDGERTAKKDSDGKIISPAEFIPASNVMFPSSNWISSKHFIPLILNFEIIVNTFHSTLSILI